MRQHVLILLTSLTKLPVHSSFIRRAMLRRKLSNIGPNNERLWDQDESDDAAASTDSGLSNATESQSEQEVLASADGLTAPSDSRKLPPDLA